MNDKMMQKEFWDSVANKNPENTICMGWSKDKFWNTKIHIPNIDKDTIFLDLGCGIGRIAKWVCPIVKKYYGIDYSPEMIKKAKERFKDVKNAKFFVNNGKNLDIIDSNSVNVVYVCLVFQHMQKETTINYIKEVYRVLKKGGVFLANNIPKKNMYSCGLTDDEIELAFNKFKNVKRKEDKHYVYIEARK